MININIIKEFINFAMDKIGREINFDIINENSNSFVLHVKNSDMYDIKYILEKKEIENDEENGIYVRNSITSIVDEKNNFTTDYIDPNGKLGDIFYIIYDDLIQSL